MDYEKTEEEVIRLAGLLYDEMCKSGRQDFRKIYPTKEDYVKKHLKRRKEWLDMPQEKRDKINEQSDEIDRIRQSVDICKIVPRRCYKCGSIELFCVSKEKQMYYCFNCNVGGNVFTYLMDKYGLHFLEAVEYLKEHKNNEEMTIIAIPNK